MDSKSVKEVGRLLGNDDKVVNTPANHFDDKNERESYEDVEGIASMAWMWMARASHIFGNSSLFRPSSLLGRPGKSGESWQPSCQ